MPLLVGSIVGVSGGAVAFGEHTATEWEDGGDPPGLRVLRAPGLDGWNDRQRPKSSAKASKSGGYGSAFHYDALVYEQAAINAAVTGIVRRGGVVEVGNKVEGPGCKDGHWYEAVPFGYVCTALGFRMPYVFG